MQALMRDFGRSCNARLYDAGTGISHVVLPEQGDVKPGMLVVGSDSHTVTYGAVNCFGTGMGSTDIAVSMLTGRTWLRVPETIRVNLTGSLSAKVSAKDAILELVRRVGVDGATYACLEFTGDGLASLSMDARFTFTNMAIEMGAKCALMPADAICEAWLSERVAEPIEPVASDPSCNYAGVVDLDLREVEPMIAAPHDLTEIGPLSEADGTPIDIAFIGTCTNGRIEDLRRAASVLKGLKVASGVQLIITPGSREVFTLALREGLIETFVDAGAVVTTPGCGPCVGTHQGIPADGHTVITTANRNFRGRMGNRDAAIYVASPATVAMSAVRGAISIPDAEA
jgi:3-isopropylmalate/(R)-2-methylmalate dehydratase large subunit